MRAQLGRRTVEHELPPVEDVRPIGDLERQRDVLLDEQHAGARSSATRRSTGIMRATIIGASPRLISSTSRSFGRPTSARPIASICCSPPESNPAAARQLPQLGEQVEELLRRSLSRTLASLRCSRTVSAGEQRAALGHDGDAGARERWAGGRRSRSPSSVIAPASGAISPAMRDSVVVLPAPFAPSRATTSPAATRSDRSRTTGMPK